MMQLVKKLGYGSKTTVHGFRATFRTWATECTKATDRVKKLSTAHKAGDKMEQAYDRAEELLQRRDLMERWGCRVMDRPYGSDD